jgi:hypothetical protein
MSAMSLVLLTGAVPLVGAEPAEAAPLTSRGCTLDVLKPKLVAGPVVKYRWSVLCVADRSIQVKHAVWEEDGRIDQRLSHNVLGPYHFKKYTEGVYGENFAPPNTESGDEEVYHCIKFRVKIRNNWGPYQSWQCSETLTIHQR